MVLNQYFTRFTSVSTSFRRTVTLTDRSVWTNIHRWYNSPFADVRARTSFRQSVFATGPLLSCIYGNLFFICLILNLFVSCDIQIWGINSFLIRETGQSIKITYFYLFSKLSVVGSLRDREVVCSDSDLQGLNFESCVWRAVSSHSSHHPQEVLLAQFSLYVHKSGLKTPDSFYFYLFSITLEASILKF